MFQFRVSHHRVISSSPDDGHLIETSCQLKGGGISAIEHLLRLILVVDLHPIKKIRLYYEPRIPLPPMCGKVLEFTFAFNTLKITVLCAEHF